MGFTFVVGKGGVGKTTIARALAREATDNGKQAKFVAFDDEPQPFDKSAKGTRPSVHSIYTEDAVEQAAVGILKSGFFAKVMVKNPLVDAMVRGAPLIKELACLECLRLLSEAAPSTAEVIVDMPATGHALSLLRLPSLVTRLFREGPIASLNQLILEKLIHSGDARVVLVALAEPLALEEALEFRERLHAETGLTVETLVINRMPEPVEENDPQLLAHLTEDQRGYLERRIAHQRSKRDEAMNASRKLQSREAQTNDGSRSAKQTHVRTVPLLAGRDFELNVLHHLAKTWSAA